MRRFGGFALVLLAIVSFGLSGFKQSTSIDRKQLRSVLEQLGYEVKDIVKDEGKEKYSVTFTQSGLDIPVGFEISPSNSYIWLTVNLGEAPTEPNQKCLELLKQNAKIQPSFFYFTEKGRMMMGLPIENREVSNALIRQRANSIADHVGETKDIWQK